MDETKEPEDKVIPEVCKQTFISTRAGLAVLWVVAGLAISGTGIAISWSRTIENDVTEIKVTQKQLQEQVIDKLDYLIRKQEGK